MEAQRRRLSSRAVKVIVCMLSAAASQGPCGLAVIISLMYCFLGELESLPCRTAAVLSIMVVVQDVAAAMFAGSIFWCSECSGQ